MTKPEAIEALKRGETIAHKLFEPGAFLTTSIIDNLRQIIDEHGNVITWSTFEDWTVNPAFNDGWGMYVNTVKATVTPCAACGEQIDNANKLDTGEMVCNDCFVYADSKNFLD